jgi:choloylglycine hydrolase
VKDNLWRIIPCIFCLVLVPITGLPCTTIVLENNGHAVYGKNVDWLPVPGFVIVNKRGIAKNSMPLPQEPDAKTIGWTSKFGSVTFNSLGREFPFEGINEAGLFVSTMGLSDTKYPPADFRTPLDALQWVQYQLDNFCTVDEVVASDKDVRILPPDTQPSMGAHFLVSDSRGNCACIEFVGGKMVCHAGQTMPYKVLANSTYDQSAAFLKLFWGHGGVFPILHPFFDPFLDASSLRRFAIAADMVQKYSPQHSGPAVDYAFQILRDVEGTSLETSAVWSAVYDSSNQQIYFRSKNKDRIRMFNLSAFDFSCTTPVKVLDVHADLAGDVSRSFIDYTKEIDLEMLRGWVPHLPDEAIGVFASFPDTTVCTEK